jgi:hypothetical protein
MIQHAKVLSNQDRWELTKFDHLPGIVILEFKNNKEVINFINSNDNLVYWNRKYLRILKIEKIRQSKVHVKVEETNLREYNLNKLIQSILKR